ncbi:hypothetical protein CgunFtcFv8_002811 [Champsocephalus gunnari]|uniref:X-ray radiation resistance-associated protein 1 n=1 Tax=Champsocephalus gunnari TaxID=52237 RepID=A0AAN8HJV0_CHAGU|nr:hypothetical protein CgunFtcFv8_002811 [Champsocephalus gunnari]
MTAASYKCDNGEKNLTKCFPPRTLLSRRKEAAGHLLEYHRTTDEQNHRNVRRRIKETHGECGNSRGAETPHNTLDGILLLQLHCVGNPSELCSVDISEQKLNSVKPEELKVFDNVVHVDASINSLSLGSFSSFVSLRKLNVSLNGISNMTFQAADFPHLEVLDLSYNSLSAEDIVSLGRLPHLKRLHLTGNQLRHLPPNLGSSNHDPFHLPDAQFGALEVLMLDDNKLSSGVFNSLANLKRGTIFVKLHFRKWRAIPGLFRLLLKEQTDKEGFGHTETHPNAAERSSFPLPELQFLNLANNKISEEEALMAVALFPMLREIDIHSNPLTTQRSGDPPLLTYYLNAKLGIRINRKKTQEALKLSPKVSTDPKWKFIERPPKVWKKPLLMEAPCPTQTHVEKSESTAEETPESESGNCRDDTFQESTEHFFVTQATQGPEFECDLQADEKEISANKADTIPERFYEMLMDTKPNPDVVAPVGIQTAVRMLEHKLKNLNVYRDSKPKLDSIQMPYSKREKRIKELPPLKPIKQPTERVDRLIKEIKESTTIRQVPLSRAIHGTGVNKQEQKEALSLLRDIKTKHKMVHKETMERAASIESERNTNLNGAEPPPVQIL